MIVVKHGSDSGALRKADQDLLDVLQRNCLRILLGTRLTDLISNSKAVQKSGSIPFSRAIMKERMRWLGQVLRMKDDRLLKIALFGQPFRAKQKAGRLHLGWEDVIKKDLKETENYLGGCKERSFEQIGMEEERALLCWP